MGRMTKPTNPLGELVDQVCDANGWSRRDVAKRAVDRGYELSHQRLSQLCTDEPLAGIQADKIHALAAALAVSPVRVALAAMAAMGVPVSDATVTPAEAIMRDPALSSDTKAALLAILRGAGGGNGNGDERRRLA